MIENRKMRPAHPGEVLADILEENNITQTEFAQLLNVSRRSVNQLINGTRSITADMAMRLGKVIGNGPNIWLNLQQKVDAWDAMQKNKAEYARLKPLTKAKQV
jgi:antitoxin HigA-1